MTRFEAAVPTESEEQQSLFRYCAVMRGSYPQLDRLVHIPNEGKRTITNGNRLKREGLKKGYPDIILDYANSGYHGLKIELKRRKGGRITPEQKEWIIELNKNGYAAVLCFGWEDAWEFIKNYLDGRKETVEAKISESMIKAGYQERMRNDGTEKND